MRKLNIIKSKNYFKRFRLIVDNKKGMFSIKGPLGIFFYSIPLSMFNIKYQTNKEKLVWFDYSSFFLDWINRAQRGVSVGYYIEMTLNGVAFKVDYLEYANALYFDLGYSHYVCYLLPDEASVKIEKRKLTIFSYDFVWLTTTAYRLKKLRWPDPYRGKGIIYKNEKIKLRPGKQRQ